MRSLGRGALGAWAFAVACVLIAVMAGQEATLREAAREAAAHQLDELANLAGLREAGAGALAVELDSDRDAPKWAREAFAEAVAASHDFARRSPAVGVVVLEVVGSERAFAVAGALWRQGWALRTPAPTRARVELGLLAAVLLVCVATARRFPVATVWALALGLQAAAWLAPWPDPPGRPTGWEVIAGGPWARSLRDFAAAGGPVQAATLAGLAAGTGLLAWFDHRRSLRTGRALPRRRVLILLGQVVAGALALEAAVRLGLWAWLCAGWGLLALAALAAPLLAARVRGGHPPATTP